MKPRGETRLPWFKFFAGDFLNQSVDASTAERGCYVSLLAYYWMNGSIPNDVSKLVKIAGLDYSERPPWLNSQFLSHWCSEDWLETAQLVASRVVDSVLFQFFERTEDGRWIHPALDEQKAELAEEHERRSLGGRMTAEKNKQASNGKRTSQREGNCPAQCSASGIQTQIENQIQTLDGAVALDNDSAAKCDRVTEEQIADWVKAYGDVDVKAELLRMDQWLKTHPERHIASPSDFGKFAVKWLSDEQDKADAVRLRAGIGNNIVSGRKALPSQPIAIFRELTDEEAYEKWDSCSPEYKRQNPWHTPVGAAVDKHPTTLEEAK